MNITPTTFIILMLAFMAVALIKIWFEESQEKVFIFIFTSLSLIVLLSLYILVVVL
jgi:hypothetical protein